MDMKKYDEELDVMVKDMYTRVYPKRILSIRTKKKISTSQADYRLNHVIFLYKYKLAHYYILIREDKGVKSGRRYIYNTKEEATHFLNFASWIDNAPKEIRKPYERKNTKESVLALVEEIAKREETKENGDQ